MRIGVLAIQGAFAEHITALQRLGVTAVELRQREHLSGLDGLVLPGGESTVMRKLLHDLGMFEPLRQQLLDGLPVFSTCAGMILMARQIEGEAASGFALMDMTVRRNAYGRQLGSFRVDGEVLGIGRFPMVFIRAPYVTAVGPQAEVLACVDGRIVAVRQGRMLSTAFHPELTGDLRLHREFLRLSAAPRA